MPGTLTGSRRPAWALPATELAALFRTGELTPRQALESVLDRFQAANPRINAVISLDVEAARHAAAAAAERWQRGRPLSPLDGVPITVKDNIHVAGMPASWGSALHAGVVVDKDEPPIALLRAGGLVVLGKTNVPEFTLQGYTANLPFGVTRNPLALDRTPGGSSGGAAAAVAAGIGPIAIGTDGGGSLRRPAAHCGLYAFKPSIGQVPRAGGFPPLLSDFEVVGPLTRSVGDLAATMALLSQPHPDDPRSLGAGWAGAPFPDRPRIAFMPRIGDAPVDPRIAKAIAGFAASLQADGCAVETVTSPFEQDQVTAAWTVVAATGLYRHLTREAGNLAGIGEATLRMVAEGARCSTADYADALAVVADVRAEASSFFERFDMMLCPSIAALAWPAADAFPPEIDGVSVGPRGHAVFTTWMNVAGLPAANVPVGGTAEAGGIGAQLVAGAGRDRALMHFMLESRAVGAWAPEPDLEL